MQSCDSHMTDGAWLFFSERDWRNSEDKSLVLGQFEGQSCELAFDFSGLLKLGCMARIFTKVINGEAHYFSVAPRFWVSHHHPELESLPKEWVDQGLIKVASRDGGYYQEVLEEAKLESELNLVRGSSIDPYGAHLLSRGIAEEGLSPIVTVHNYANMSRPMKELAAAIESGRFHHDGNPVMTWCISNVVGKYPPGGNLVRPVKQDRQREISGAVALIMAIENALKCDTTAQKASHIEFYLKQTEYKSEISGEDLRIGLGIIVRGGLLASYFVRYEADWPAAPITQRFSDNEGKAAFDMYNSIVAGTQVTMAASWWPFYRHREDIMPPRTPKACRVRGCRSTTTDPSGYCEGHKGEGWKQYKPGQTRHQRGYGTKWETIRSRILKRDKGLCQEHLKQGVAKSASCVDHITPKAHGGTDADSNLQSLCWSCHASKTGRERLK